MNYKQCAKLLLTHENILIVTHRNPDGDTVASAAALCSALRRGGTRVAAVFMGESANVPNANAIYGRDLARIRRMDQLAAAAGRLIQDEIRELAD